MTPTLAAPPTIADRELIRAARQRGVRLSIDQLRTWRRLGLMPSPHRRHLGRGRGTVSEYPPNALDAACAVAQLPWPIRRHPDRAALTLFARRQPVAEPLLRDAWRRWLDQLGDEAQPRTDEPDTLAAAERMLDPVLGVMERSPLGRAMSRRLSQHEAKKPPDQDRETAPALLFATLTGLFRLLLGDTLPAGIVGIDGTALTEVQTALGLSAPPDPDVLTLAGMTETVATASLATLAQARDDMQDALRTLGDFGAVERRLPGVVPPSGFSLFTDIPESIIESPELVALGISLMLRLRSRNPDGYATLLTAVRDQAPHFAAMRSFLDSLPPELTPTPTALATMSDRNRQRFRARLARWSAAHPELAAQLP